jgi:hypothetical protein
LIALVLAVFCAQPADAAADNLSNNELTRFFVWWNGAIKTPGAFTDEAFGKYLTKNAILLIDGRKIIDGLSDWTEHFRKIQAETTDVVLAVPFVDGFRAGNRIYTLHVIRSRKDGVATCMLAAGSATVTDGKLSEISLVRSLLSAEAAAKNPECYH